MSISKMQAWVAGAVVVSLLLTVAAWFLLISPQRAEAASVRDQTASVVDSNARLELQIAELKSEFADLPQRQAELAVVKKALPETVQLPTLVRDLDALATSSGVTLMTLTPAAAVPVVSAAPAAVAVPDPAAAGAEAPAAPEAADAAAVPAASADTLTSTPISIVLVGNFYDTEVFLRGLQTEFARDFLVTGLNVVAETAGEAAGGKPAVENGDVTMTITGSVFVLQSAAPTAASGSASAPPGAPADATVTN